MSPELILFIILIAVLYGIYSLIYYIKSNKEYFSGAAASTRYDIAGYLATREEYDISYNDTVRTASYNPPLLYSTQQKRTVEAPLTDADFSGMQIVPTPQLERAVFTYYGVRQTSFIYAETYNLKTPIERYIDENCRLARRSIVARIPYLTYITIGGRNYEVKKAFTGVREVLGCAGGASGAAVFMGVGLAAPVEYGRWNGEATESAFRKVLEATSQAALNEGLMPATGSASASAAGAGAADPGTAANRLQLSPLTYLPDARMRNKQLFDGMYRTIRRPSAALATYYRNTIITAPGDSYVATVAKFIQLDKWILAGATVGSIIDTSQLVGADGSAYMFRPPFPYNPKLGLTGDKEAAADPLESARDLKAYDLQGAEADILTYFKTRRLYESAALTNAQIANKLREGICASAGYYARTNLSKCKVNGCCIPVSYRPQTSAMAAGAGAAQSPNAGLSAESQGILGKVDNCIHMQSQFQIRRTGPVLRIGPSPTCIETREGFVDLPANYGGGLEGAKLKGQMQELKGWAISPLGRASL
jgi:hypothetical protein